VRRLRIILRNVSVSLRCGNGLCSGTPTPRNLHQQLIARHALFDLLVVPLEDLNRAFTVL
jgi:hypothetical protein